MKELPHTHSCFVCGESNPLGLKLRFHTDGRVVTARFKPCPEHIGFKGVIHGGITAIVYTDQRMRREGFDLTLTRAAMARTESP